MNSDCVLKCSHRGAQTYLGQLEYVASEQTLYPVLGRDSVGGKKAFNLSGRLRLLRSAKVPLN